MIEIANNGQAVASTNYWSTEHGRAGLCFLSTNAGALRLLVPRAAQAALTEMRTGTSVTIEPPVRAETPGCVDIVFEDGTDAPFRLTIDRRQTDHALKSGRSMPFTVWTEDGLHLTLTALIRV
jgi:hypothetical protein